MFRVLGIYNFATNQNNRSNLLMRLLLIRDFVGKNVLPLLYYHSELNSRFSFGNNPFLAFSTAYGHKLAKSLILCGPNSNPNLNPK